MTRNTASRAATHQIQTVGSRGGRANEPAQIQDSCGPLDLPRQPTASSTSSNYTVTNYATCGKRPSITGNASAHEAQHAAGAVLRAERRHPPILIGKLATLRATSSCQAALPRGSTSLVACRGHVLLRTLPNDLAAQFGRNGNNVALRTGPEVAMRTANPGPMGCISSANLSWAAASWNCHVPSSCVSGPISSMSGGLSPTRFQVLVFPVCNRIPALDCNLSANKLWIPQHCSGKQHVHVVQENNLAHAHDVFWTHVTSSRRVGPTTADSPARKQGANAVPLLFSSATRRRKCRRNFFQVRGCLHSWTTCSCCLHFKGRGRGGGFTSGSEGGGRERGEEASLQERGGGRGGSLQGGGEGGGGGSLQGWRRGEGLHFGESAWPRKNRPGHQKSAKPRRVAKVGRNRPGPTKIGPNWLS